MSAMNSDQPHRRFNFVYSCDVDLNFRIKIGTLQGERQKPSYRALIDDLLLKYSGISQDGCSDLYVTCQIYSDDKEISLPIQTSYKAFSTKWNWNEWLILPVKFSDLPRNSVLAFTVWDIHKSRQAIPVGGTSVHIFGKYGAVRQGIHDLRLWHNTEADGNFCSKTPGKIDCNKEQMLKLAKLTKKHRNGHMIKVDWLDRLTFREIEMINEKEKRLSNYMYLMIEFPKIVVHGTDYTVVYFEKDGCIECHHDLHTDIVTVPDPEIPMQNLVEAKHHKLFRGIRSGLSDKDLKPNAATRDQLNVIVSYPANKSLSSEEQDLVWKFRFYLTNEKKALSKFLKCVNWKIPVETKQALDMLKEWQAMDVEDALELLSPQYTHSAVRRYAVTRLQQAHDEDLLMYLMQLVQALKYENFDEIRAGLNDILKGDSFSTSADVENSAEKERTRSLSSEKQSHPDTCLGNLKDQSTSCHKDFSVKQELPSNNECDLATFLINRAVANDTLANYFYWYLAVECEERENTAKDSKGTTGMYVTVLKRFSQVLKKGSPELEKRRKWLSRQISFVNWLANVMSAVGKESGNRSKKIEKLHALLFDTESNETNFTSFDPLPLPLDPSVKVKGIVPEKAILFKSAMMPVRLTFLTSENTEYVTIFKHGDDLRQDQLVIQTIMLMDKLLRRENLDLKLTPYRVLASSSKHGFLQYVESIAIAQVLQQEGTIQKFFRKYAPSENGPYGIAAEVMDTYVKSCAGYCVITYLLGVGDRHLDNLLLTKTGKLLHIDFGYILGRDPKPLPPPMKLSKEMVEAMGGVNSEHYQDFHKQCYTAFLCLRRHANLFLNLFALMVDANVPDIALEPDKTVKKVRDKFRLDLADEEALCYVKSIIDESVSAVVAVVFEQFHRFAQVLKYG